MQSKLGAGRTHRQRERVSTRQTSIQLPCKSGPLQALNTISSFDRKAPTLLTGNPPALSLGRTHAPPEPQQNSQAPPTALAQGPGQGPGRQQLGQDAPHTGCGVAGRTPEDQGRARGRGAPTAAAPQPPLHSWWAEMPRRERTQRPGGQRLAPLFAKGKVHLRARARALVRRGQRRRPRGETGCAQTLLHSAPDLGPATGTPRGPSAGAVAPHLRGPSGAYSAVTTRLAALD